MAGQEVVQIYVQDPRTLPFVPYWKRMLGFARTPTLGPGAKATVDIPLLWCVSIAHLSFNFSDYGCPVDAPVLSDPYVLVLMRAPRVDVAMFDDTMNLKLWPGAYTISVGGASNDTPLNTTVAL